MIPIRQYWNLLATYLRRQRRRVAALAVTLTAAIGLQAVAPQYIKWFIDGAIGGDPVGALVPLAVGFLVLSAVQQVFSVGAAWLAELVGWNATNDLRRDLAAHLLRLDMSFHKRHTPGEMVERVDGDVTALSNFFGKFAVHIVGNALLVLAALILIARESLLLGAVVAVVSIGGFVGMARLQQIATEWWRRVRAERARFFGFVGEVAGATEDVQASGAAPYIERRATQIMRDWVPHEVRGHAGFSLLWSAEILAYVLGNAAIFAIGGWLFTRGSLSLGSVYLIFHYAEMMRHPLERIRNQFEDMQKAGAGIVRIRELFDIEPALADRGDRHLPAGPLSVRLERVDFAYDDGQDDEPVRVLHGLDIELRAGRVLGVLGRTGSGKTTLARLLTRLYDPESGRVLIGGVPAADVPLAELRGRMGMVTQDVQLLRASIRDNLTFFDATVPDDQLWTALDELGIAGWVRSRSDDLDTMLEAGGGGLSAGEAQLLALARIFLEDPGLVILDEASSRLDPATERLIERALDRLLAGRTGVIIAHRLDTLRRADDIVIVDEGRVVEHGERAALAADPASRYAGLLRTGIEEVLV